jgi:membrane-associated phospholipid phosphatase
VIQARSSRAATLVALVIAFILVGWGVGALVTSALTSADLDAVRDVASDRTAAATVVAHLFSWIGSGFVVFPVALACCLTLYRRRRRAAALAVVLSTVGAEVIIDLDKLLVGRPRPPLHHLDRVTGHSFPSGHTGQAAALCAVLVIEGFMLRGQRPPQFAALVLGGLLVACVAFSRVYLGVHYPSDVVAGAVLGASWSALAIRLGHLWTSADERPEIPVGPQGAAWAR